MAKRSKDTSITGSRLISKKSKKKQDTSSKKKHSKKQKKEKSLRRHTSYSESESALSATDVNLISQLQGLGQSNSLANSLDSSLQNNNQMHGGLDSIGSMSMNSKDNFHSAFDGFLSGKHTKSQNDYMADFLPELNLDNLSGNHGGMHQQTPMMMNHGMQGMQGMQGIPQMMSGQNQMHYPMMQMNQGMNMGMQNPMMNNFMPQMQDQTNFILSDQDLNMFGGSKKKSKKKRKSTKKKSSKSKK